MTLHALFHCPNCRAALDLVSNNATIVRCDYCHSMVIVPDSLRQKTERPLEEKAEIKKRARLAKPKLSVQKAVEEVTRLARDGQQIQAIKLYRETFPVGLKEAKEGVEQVEAGGTLPIPAVSWEDESDLPVAAAEEIMMLIAAGKMDEAAKLYRITFDTSHVEAETAVGQLSEGKSIDVARRTAKREAQATAVRPEPAPEQQVRNPRSKLLLVVSAAVVFVIVLVVLFLILAML